VWVAAPNANASDGTTTATATATSSPATRFLTGFLDAAEWEGAEWLIAATPDANLCRHPFSLLGAKKGAAAAPKRAVLLISGLGYFRATIVSQPAAN